MAVLVEGISVVIRKAAIETKMTGGWERFRLLIPNGTLCDDGELVRVGFLAPDEVREFIGQLEELGLCYLEEGSPVDLIVCDQQQGPATECNWIEFARLAIDGGKVGLAWLWEGKRFGKGMSKGPSNVLHMRKGMTIATPPGWHFKDSLSDKYQFVPNNLVSQRRDH